MDESVTDWFVVVPDAASAAPACTALSTAGAQRVDHASGRPWILGRWAASRLTLGQARGARLAVLGEHGITEEMLARVAARLRSIAELDAVLRSQAIPLAGSFHVLASVAGQVRVQGTVSGLRPVHCARVEGATVGADGADVLRGLVGAPVDEGRLALRLLAPPVVYPVTEEPVWRGVTAVPAGHYLALDDRGGHRFVRHWRAPDASVPMAQGAPVLRERLAAAVQVRTQGRELVSTDMGGLDSTSLCCLAARAGTHVVAYTADGRDPVVDDVTWAHRTVADLDDDVEHHVLPWQWFPLHYGGLSHLDEPGDEPCSVAVDRDRWLVVVRAAAERGSRLHFAGFGGDELLWGSPAHLHGMLLTSPAAALQKLRGFATIRRWPYRQALWQLADRRPYRAWLRQVADELTAPVDEENVPTLAWGRAPRLPSWATADAVQQVRTLIHAAAPEAQPIAPTHGLHEELTWVRSISRVVRQLGQMAAREGVLLGAPYYDDGVIEAALSVRPQDRISPWRYKPLIGEAMAGIVPARTLARSTKDDGGHDAEAGLQEHRPDLLALWEDSRLGRLGLVDVPALRETCARPLPPTLPAALLNQTVACEMWLRSLERPVTPAVRAGQPGRLGEDRPEEAR